MVKKTKAGGLVAALGSAGKKAFKNHRDDDVNFGAGGDLPEGIEAGVAQLVDCKFSKYEKGDNKGQYFFYAAGIVVSPETHNGMHIVGLRTSIMEPMCDTPNRSRKTVEEHIGWDQNEMKKLGVDLSENDIEDLEAIAGELKESKPHFRFRSWKGDPTPEYPNPRVNEQ